MMRQQLCSSCLYHPSKSLPSLSLYLVHVVCIYPHACYSFLHLSPFFWVQFSFARSKSYPVQFSSVQFSSVAQSCPTLCDPMNHSTPGLPVHHQLPSSLRLTSIELVMPSNHLSLCCTLLLCPQSFPASGSFQMSQLFASAGQRNLYQCF